MPITAEQVSELVEPIVTERGFDLEDVTIAAVGGRSAVTVVVDSDEGSDLDDLAALNRDISARLDDTPAMADAVYNLEVTSRGLDRPLTCERHWRRARGRKVIVDLVGTDGQTRRITGRVGESGDGTVRIVVNNRGRLSTEDIDLASVTTATVQVDFARPSAAELASCGLTDDEVRRRRSNT